MKKHTKTLFRKLYNVVTRRIICKFRDTKKLARQGDYWKRPKKFYRNKKGDIRVYDSFFIPLKICLNRLWTNPHKAKRNRRKTYSWRDIYMIYKTPSTWP